jgi:2-amino-4-hydroxy-6-hydroxymethyldihydropteridine diphosphokinase
MSARVFVGLGSNLDPEVRMQKAVSALREQVGEVEISPVYDSEAVGFEGSNFLNLVVAFDTDVAVSAVVDIFHQIENQLGRDRSQPKFSNRPIDLDILLYDDLILDIPGICIPRPEILENAFVLKPLQDLIPQQLHPEMGESYASLWERMAPTAPQLELVQIDL